MKIGNKIIIIGTSCVGKTTFGANLSSQLKYTHIDLDDFHWLPNWIEKADDDFLKDIDKYIVSLDNWVVSGNYFSLVKDNLWKSADTIIWLNYSLPTILYRYIKRTYRRIVLKEPCCNGNYENIKHSFFSSENLFFWILKTHSIRKEKIETMRLTEFKFKNWLELATPQSAELLLKSI